MLGCSTYFVREHVGAFKITDTYDIVDAESQKLLGVAREEPPVWAKWLRLLISKGAMPTAVKVYADGADQPLFSIERGFTLLRSSVRVLGKDGQPLGMFVTKLFTLGGAFTIYNNSGIEIAQIQGDWKGWNYKLIGQDGTELGSVSKQWAGLKELFTSADHYFIQLAPNEDDGAAGKLLLLAACLAIDIIYKEGKR